MQKWKVDDDAVVWTAEDGEWVPADVAKGLYDLVAVLVEHAAWYPSAIELDHAIGCGPGGDDLESDAIAALAAADGEEV